MSYLIVLSPRHKTNNKNQCYDQLTVVNRASADQCHMTVPQAQVYNSLRCSVFFLSSLLTCYGTQVITGSENFASESKLPQELCFLPWLHVYITLACWVIPPALGDETEILSQHNLHIN